MKSKEKRNFVASFLKEAENLDICRKYPDLKDGLDNVLINPKNGDLWIAIQQAGDFFEEVKNTISSFINEEEVVYFEKAIQVLADLDSSLKNSLNIAEQLGYDIKDLNSELLATLVIQNKLREELLPLIEELEEEVSY